MIVRPEIAKNDSQNEITYPFDLGARNFCFFFISVILILIDYSLRSSRAILFWRALIFTTQLLGVLAKTNTKATCG